MDTNNPMILMSVTILNRFGFLYPEDNRVFFTLIPTCILLVLQMSFIYFTEFKLEPMMLNVFFSTVWLNCFVRILSVVISIFVE